MKYATPDDLKEIYGHFLKRKDVFPHVRQDKLKRFIEAGLMIWQDGVVITYQQYKKRTKVGEVQIPAGAIMLHQILNSQQFSGRGSRSSSSSYERSSSHQEETSISASARRIPLLGSFMCGTV
jgi:hypothetical protein